MLELTHRSCVALVGALILAPLFFLGCDSESDDIVNFGNSRPTIDDFDGSDQVTSPGGTLSRALRIVVTDGDDPAENVNVSWLAQEGTLSGDSKTDSSGVATATWTLGDATQRRFAVASGGISGSSVNFVAFVVPDDDVVVIVQDDAFAPSSVTVTPGTTVTWIWPTTATGHNVEPIGGSVLPDRSGDPVDGPYLFSQEIFFAGLFNYQCVSHGAQGTINANP